MMEVSRTMAHTRKTWYVPLKRRQPPSALQCLSLLLHLTCLQGKRFRSSLVARKLERG